MGSVEWSGKALEQLEEIVAYIEIFDPIAAQGVASRLWALCDSLASFPRRGRPAGNGAREMATVRPYFLRYQIDGDRNNVVILGVRHSARLPDDNAR